MQITAYLNPYCPWSPGVLAVLDKYKLAYETKDITRDRLAYDQMVAKSGQFSSPCVEIDGTMLSDVGSDEVEDWLIGRGLVVDPTSA